MSRRSRTVPTSRSARVKRRPPSRALDKTATLKTWLSDKGIRKAKVGGVDIDGVWRGKYVSLEKFLSAAQSGMGFIVDVLPGSPMQLLAAWLTFSPQGDPSWIVGLGPVQGDEAILPATQVVGSGARFPPSFDPTNVHTQSWGELTFTFSDCNHGHVDWSSTISGYGSAGMDLTRLTLPAGLTCPGGAIPQPDSGNRSP